MELLKFGILNMIEICLKSLALLPLVRPDLHKKFQKDPLITFGVVTKTENRQTDKSMNAKT